jgi:hypothetical protein
MNVNKIDEKLREISAWLETPEGQEHLKKIARTLEERQKEIKERDNNREKFLLQK